MLVGKFGERFGIGDGTGGGLGMNKGQDLRIRVSLQCRFSLGGINGNTPFILNHDRGAATALHIFLHAATEDTVLADDHLVTRLNQVDKTHLHTGRTRCRHRH